MTCQGDRTLCKLVPVLPALIQVDRLADHGKGAERNISSDRRPCRWATPLHTQRTQRVTYIDRMARTSTVRETTGIERRIILLHEE
jgi:hypothetical protein